MNYSRSVKYYREHYTLTNGQNLGIYYKKERLFFHFNPSENFTVYDVGAVIGETRRQCNDWYEVRRNKRQRKIKHKSTGRVGLEGLIAIYKSIKNLIKEIKNGDFIVVFWANEKRKKAYKYLERLGFEEGVYRGESCYYYQKGE